MTIAEMCNEIERLIDWEKLSSRAAFFIAADVGDAAMHTLNTTWCNRTMKMHLTEIHTLMRVIQGAMLVGQSNASMHERLDRFYEPLKRAVTFMRRPAGVWL